LIASKSVGPNIAPITPVEMTKKPANAGLACTSGAVWTATAAVTDLMASSRMMSFGMKPLRESDRRKHR